MSDKDSDSEKSESGNQVAEKSYGPRYDKLKEMFEQTKGNDNLKNVSLNTRFTNPTRIQVTVFPLSEFSIWSNFSIWSSPVFKIINSDIHLSIQYISKTLKKHNERQVGTIATKDGSYKPDDTEEKDHKAMIRHWKAKVKKQQLKGTLNMMHIKDETIIKRDVERNLKILNDNYDVLGTTNGF